MRGKRFIQSFHLLIERRLVILDFFSGELVEFCVNVSHFERVLNGFTIF